MSIQLRPYQSDAIAEIEARFLSGHRCVLYVLPTGGGKTTIFVEFVRSAIAKGERVLILVHRQELVDQTVKALTDAGIECGVIAAGYPAAGGELLHVGMVQTVSRRIAKIGRYDLIVVDEAHHAIASTWKEFLALQPQARILGVTATPERLDGRGLGSMFEAMIIGPDIKALTADKHLCPSALYVNQFDHKRNLSDKGVSTVAGDFQQNKLAAIMSDAVVIQSAVDEYANICPGKRAIVFCVDIMHSQLVARAFKLAGWRTAHIDGDTDKDERRKLIKALGSGDVQVLCNCGLISEGLDVPAVEAVILLRPTASLALHLQQIGRALRPGKEKAFVLDHSGNLLRHGRPLDPREWSLSDRPKQPFTGDRVKRCEHCGCANDPSAIHCEECGTALCMAPMPDEPLERDRQERESKLVELDQAMIEQLPTMRYHDAVAWAGRDRDRLEIVRQARGYKKGWTWHMMQESASAV